MRMRSSDIRMPGAGPQMPNVERPERSYVLGVPEPGRQAFPVVGGKRHQDGRASAPGRGFHEQAPAWSCLSLPEEKPKVKRASNSRARGGPEVRSDSRGRWASVPALIYPSRLPSLPAPARSTPATPAAPASPPRSSCPRLDLGLSFVQKGRSFPQTGSGSTVSRYSSAVPRR